MWLINAYKEAKIWYKVRKVALSFKDKLESVGFRVDWIGRIYTVINLPEEVITSAPQIQEGYVLMKLRDYDKIFLQLGLAGDIYPEMQRINEDETAAFLLVLTPERDYLTLWSAIKFIIKTLLLILILRIVYVMLNHNWELIISKWNWILEKTQIIM